MERKAVLYLRFPGLRRNLHHRQMRENLRKDKDKQGGFSRVRAMLLSRARFTFIKRLCSFGDVNCGHQIKASSGRRPTRGFMNRAAQMARVCKQARLRAKRSRARARAEEPVNESTVLAQTEQAFPHVLEVRGSIRTAAPRWWLAVSALGFVFALSHILAEAI